VVSNKTSITPSGGGGWGFRGCLCLPCCPRVFSALLPFACRGSAATAPDPLVRDSPFFPPVAALPGYTDPSPFPFLEFPPVFSTSVSEVVPFPWHRTNPPYPPTACSSPLCFERALLIHNSQSFPGFMVLTPPRSPIALRVSVSPDPTSLMKQRVLTGVFSCILQCSELAPQPRPFPLPPTNSVDETTQVFSGSASPKFYGVISVPALSVPANGDSPALLNPLLESVA